MDIREVISSIKALRIPHPRYQEAENATLAHATLSPEGCVVALVGPTRVGKSSVVRPILPMAFARKSYANDALPSIVVSADPTDRGAMSTRYLLLEMLRALRHPFYDGQTVAPRTSSSETTLRFQLGPSLEHRGTKLIVVDEAQHLLRARDHRAVAGALDTVKCIGNASGAIILLVAGYSLLTTCFESPHLNGRLTVIDFPRYEPKGRDVEHFDRLLCTFDKKLPFANGVSLFVLRQLIYDGSLGCCGLVSNWIVAALARMHAQGDRRLTRKHFESTRYEQQMVSMRKEILLGESLLSRLRSDTSWVAPVERNAPVKKRQSRPGLRKPTRDPVAGSER